MRKSKVLVISLITALIGITYNACSKFQTLDSNSEFLLSSAGENSSISDFPDSNNSSGNPIPTPQNNEVPITNTPSNITGDWANEPSGAKVVLDCPFNSLSDCGIEDVYRSSQIVSDSTAPVSKSNVLKSTLVAGKPTGGMQLGYLYPKISREMYVGLIWRTNSEFQGRAAGNKTFFMRGPDSIGVFVIQGGLASGTGPLVWAHNSGALDNSHVCSVDLGLLCFPNVTSGLVQRGVWTKIEAYIKASTTNTSRDGIVRWWINGTLAGNYTNINYAGAGLNEWIWTETWDGCGGNPKCDLGNVNTSNWEHYIDHLRISTR